MRLISALSSLAVTLLAGAPVAAESIDFEDRQASNGQVVLSDQYVLMGVRFATTNGSTWAGRSGGDPGGWQLEGSAGPAFLGLEGRSSVVAIHFDAAVQDFQLDVARGAGSTPSFYDSVTVYGLRDGAVVDSDAVYLGGVDEWIPLSLTGEMDQVVLRGIGFYVNHRFGVDALRWQGGAGAPPQELAVAIDIHPGSARNPIRPGSRGVVPVAIYGSSECDVSRIDKRTLTFGPANAALAHAHGPHVHDMNGDGHMDAMLHYRVEESGLGAGDETACVQGMLDGRPLRGCDKVSPLPER
jgi:hypothetical protein